MKNYLKDVNNSEFEELTKCKQTMKKYEELLQIERNRKDVLLQKIQNAYTEKLKGKYFKLSSVADLETIGKIEYVYCKSNKFLINTTKINVTVNGKVMMVPCKYELTDEIIEKMQFLTEEEYKAAFYDYVIERIITSVDEEIMG